MADNLGTATLQLGVDNTGLQSGMTEAESQVGAGTIAIGAFVAQLAMQMVNQLVGAAKQFISAITTGSADYGSFIEKLEAESGIGAASIQKIGEAFSIGGISEDQSAMMIKRFESFVAHVQDGDKAYTDSMKKMGLSTQQFMSLDEEGKLNAVMTALGGLKDKNQEALISTQMFGRSSQDMALVIQRWPELFDKANASMSHFGLTQEQIDNLQKSREDMTQLGDETGMLSTKIGAELAPNTDKLVQALIKLVSALSDWLDKNPQLIKDMGDIIDFLTKCIDAATFLVPILGKVAEALVGIGEMSNPLGMLVNISKGPTASGSVSIPGFASGGIAMSPQLAMVGEAGPEAIIPLNQMQNMGGTSLSVNVGNFMGDDMSLRQFVRTIQAIQQQEQQRSVTPRVQSQYYSVGGHL